MAAPCYFRSQILNGILRAKCFQQRLQCSQEISRGVFRHTTNRKYSHIAIDNVGPVRLIAINRPEKRNAVNRETARELSKAVASFDDDSSSKVAVLYGKGGMFCAGYDLSEVSSMESSDVSLSEKEGPMGPTKMVTVKPVVAAIEGYAVAGGLELALWCDLRVMEDTAILGVFCRRFGCSTKLSNTCVGFVLQGKLYVNVGGVPLIDGGTVRLPKLIGLSRAMDLILTGREVRAKEALDIGLVNRVCETGTAVGGALLLAQEICKFPQECMRVDRSSAYYSAYSADSMEDALQHEMEGGVNILSTESVKGARRFVTGVGRHGSFNLRRNQLTGEKEED